MTHKAAAFFDLDRTLIKENSALLYTRYEYALGRIGILDFIKSAWWLGLYHLNLLNINKAYSKAVSTYKGQSERELMAHIRRFFVEKVDKRLLPGAQATLCAHRSEGHELVLITNGSSYQAQLATQSWRLDYALANSFLTDESGLLTGDFCAPLCYGQGKVERAERWARTHEVSLEHSYFYSDSYSDLPLLERVGHPRVVNPDPKLRRLAQRRQWPVMNWKEVKEKNSEIKAKMPPEN